MISWLLLPGDSGHRRKDRTDRPAIRPIARSRLRIRARFASHRYPEPLSSRRWRLKTDEILVRIGSKRHFAAWNTSKPNSVLMWETDRLHTLPLPKLQTKLG